MTDTNPPADRIAEADMRREIVLREINQGALAGMSSEITGQAADLVLAALDKYDAWKAEQTSGDLTEVRDALRPPYMLALGNLIADAQTDTHWTGEATGSTGPYIVQGCNVYSAQQLKDAVRTVWTRGPALLDRLAASEARVEELEGQLAAVRARLDEQRGATRVAAGAADRFRDVLSEVLGHSEENPGDDVLVDEVREHFGFSGPEPTRWREFLTGARAQIDQIEADHAGGTEELIGPDTLCPCRKTNDGTGSGYCSHECFNKYDGWNL